jgi:glutathione S-transferase
VALIEHPSSPLVPKLRGVHLFGFDGAPCSQRVSFALAEKGLLRGATVPWASEGPDALTARAGTYTFRPVSLVRQEHLSAAYAAIQPNMVVPALVHDSALHIESMDIIDYLDARWLANPLTPTESARARLCEELVDLGKSLHVSVRYVSFRWGLKGLGKIDAAHEEELRRLERAGSPEQLVQFYTRFNRDQIDAEAYLGHLRALESGWGAQDARLAADGRPFLTGETFTKADIIWSIKVLRILECGYPFATQFPALHSWFRRVSSRRGFRDGVMRSHRAMSLAFRAKAAVENLLGTGIRKSTLARHSGAGSRADL